MRDDIDALSQRFASNDEGAVATAIQDADALLDQWASRDLTGNAGPLDDENARARLRTALVESLDADRTRPLAASTIWLLGKLFDASLESYFADLLELYVARGDLFSHLHQTLIALDNLGAIAAAEHDTGWSNCRESFPRMQRIGSEYLRHRRPRV